MAPKTANLSIVFADVAGSTRLYDTLGDAIARPLVAQCLELMTEITHKYSGTVIKTIGDEIMCTFPSAESGVEAAMAMQEAVVEDLPSLNPNAPTDLAIRVGLHYGPAILEKNDVFGDAVNVAARMAGLAKAGQIITTQSTAEELSPALRSSTRHLDRIPVKGKSDVIDIFEVIWQAEDVTRMATGILSSDTVRASLLLKYHEQTVKLTQQNGPFVLGRGKKADMVVADSMASREHSRIEFRRGKFFLIDQSTNGTYVVTGEGPSYLRRDEAVLTGEGKISLGRDFREGPTEVVFFKLE